jgi:Tol biopolymer transport system component
MNRNALRLTAALLALTAGVGCSSDDDADDVTATTTGNATASSTTPPAAADDDTVVRDGEPWVVFHGVELGLTLARLDGTGLHTILDGHTDHPDWSPDGAEIAYVDDGEVWITDTAGEHPRRLVEAYPAGLDDLYYWEDPAWTRDGTRIAMVGYGGSPEGTPARSVLAIVDVASGQLTVAGELDLADGLHSFPRWSPAGDALVLNVDHFTGETYDGGTVAVVRESGGSWSAPQPITEHGQYGRVDWHPTDDLIVFGQYDIGFWEDTDEPTNLFTIRPDGTERTAVTAFGPGEARAAQPTWTTDGRILFAYVTGNADADRAVAMIDADGSNLQIVLEPAVVGEHNRPYPRLQPAPA